VPSFSVKRLDDPETSEEEKVRKRSVRAMPEIQWSKRVDKAGSANNLLVRHEVVDVTAGRQMLTSPPVLPGVSHRSVRRWCPPHLTLANRDWVLLASPGHVRA